MSATADPAETVQGCASEEDLLLTRAAAEQLLRDCSVTYSRVIRVCEDGAILYVREGRVGSEFAMTAWPEDRDGRTDIRLENGWPERRGPGLVIYANTSDIQDHDRTD